MAGERIGLANVRMLLAEQGLVIWKRRWLAVVVCWAVCLIGWAGVSVLPKRYESSARAYVDVNGYLAPLLKGLVVEAGASQNIDYMRQTLLTRPNLEQAAYMANLAKPGADSISRERLISDLANTVVVKPAGQNLISISYVSSSPTVARDVVRSLLAIFGEKVSATSRTSMDRARSFLNAQIALYEKKLNAADARRADFLKTYSEYLPDSTSGTPRLQLLETQLAQYQHDYDAAVITKDATAGQMASVPQYLSVDSAPTVSTAGNLVTASPATRLAQAEHTLAELKLNYTDKHPDVIAAQRTVSELRAVAGSGSAAREGKMQVPNPTYDAVRVKYIDAAVAVPIAKKRLDDTAAELARVKAIATQIPGIEAKFKELDRDYGALKANYDELLKRRESAALSQAADDQADRTQFRVVDPPQAPIDPQFPNLPLMYSLVLVAAIAAAAGIPLVLGQMHPVFNSTVQLRDLGLPVLGAVLTVSRASGASWLATPAARRLAVASLGVLGLYAMLMVFGVGVFRGGL